MAIDINHSRYLHRNTSHNGSTTFILSPQDSRGPPKRDQRQAVDHNIIIIIITTYFLFYFIFCECLKPYNLYGPSHRIYKSK